MIALFYTDGGWLIMARKKGINAFKDFVKKLLKGDKDFSGRKLLEEFRKDDGEVSDKKAYKFLKELREGGIYNPIPSKREIVPRETIEKEPTKNSDDLASFDDFYRYISPEGKMSVKEARNLYRSMGGKISNAKSLETVRKIRGVDKDVSKMTRTTLKPRKSDRNFKKFIGAKYVWLMVYDVVDNRGNKSQRLIFVGTDTLEITDAVEAVIVYWKEEYRKRDDERYTDFDIDMESIRPYKDKSGYHVFINN